MDEYNKTDWALVVKYMRGEGRKALPIGVENKLWTMADGFGPGLHISVICNQLEWDWSHIRDSSGAAVTRMADYLRWIGLN